VSAVDGLHPLDAYLLDGNPTKAQAIAAVLSDRRPIERAQAFYRALDALGAKVADEALIALRLTLAGRTADDAAIATLRTQVAAARRGDAMARAAYLAAVETA
jgi:isoaspartyl peptidase/L-asparaginase-like protein (Ntn-hydrolase superfamily)